MKASKDKSKIPYQDGATWSDDWPKRSWDIHGTPAVQADLLAGERSTPLPDQQARLDAFMRLPAACAMPWDVRRELMRRGLYVPLRSIQEWGGRIGLNTLLLGVGLDLGAGRLVRHSDPRYPDRPSVYDLWRAHDERFELYQSLQDKRRYGDAAWIASFVVTPLQETVFVGVYTIEGVGPTEPDIEEPHSGLKGLEASTRWPYHYQLKPAQALSAYRGCLIVDWGKGRNFVQLPASETGDKAIIEIRSAMVEPRFPGFADFCWRVRDLASVPQSWRTALSAVSGVYLLTECKTGKQYVGSASGAEGFWQRWQDYLVTGDGGNKKMKEVPDGDYQVSVLEVAGSSTSPEALAQMETRWKLKLLSRTFGLNRN
jgi:hypothetical protein